ncbi:MAG: DUF6493 family protein [Verrucomicrobiota bacterium]
MKTLEDAIAASATAERLRILKTLSPKEYPALLKAVEETRLLFRQEISATYQFAEEEQEAMREAVYQKIHCLDLAETVASLAKKKLACHLRSEVLLCTEVADFLAENSPAWLPKLIHGSTNEVILRYSSIESIPRPPEGDSYYEALAEHIFVQSEGLEDRIRHFLTDNPVILNKDVHVMIRQMARKRGVNRLNVYLHFGYISSEDRGRRLTYPYLGQEAGIRFAKTHTQNVFALMRVARPLFDEGDFRIQPILKTILETLADVQREFEARNVLDVYDQLAPAPEQCMELQDGYFVLLSSPHKAVARFAIDMIEGFAGSKGFDAESFVSQVDAIFTHASNPLQIAGMKLVGKIADLCPEIAGRIPERVASGLLNPDPKVQAAILALLESLPASAQNEINEAISPFSDRIIPSLRSAFEKWLGKTKASPVLEPACSGGFATVLGDRLVPLASVDELPFLASELLSGKAGAMRFELFLDGLARFAASDRKKLATAFGSVEARARRVAVEGGRNGFFPGWLETLTARLVLHFGPDPSILVSASGDFGPPPETSEWPAPIKEWGFAPARIEELVQAIDQGSGSQPLATPEFAHGFIGSETLLSRLRSLRDQKQEPMHFDFIQAIARCHPSGGDLPGSADEASRVLRYRLTGEIEAPIGKPAWWLAAARAREPDGDFSNHPYFSQYHVEGQSDWTSPAIWRNPSTIGFSGGDGLNARSYINWFDPNRRDLYYDHDEIPVDHLYPLQHVFVGADPSALCWRYSFTPGFLDGPIAEDIQHTCKTWPDTVRKHVDSAAAVMRELSSRRPPLRHPLQVHLMLALNSASRAEREAAVDLFLQASSDGRLADATTGLGLIFRQLLENELGWDEPLLQLGRVVPLLRQLSTHGPLIQIQLRDLLLTAIEHPQSSIPKGFPSLLEVLLDLVTAHPPGREIDLNAVWGGRLDGKSKTLATRIAKACSN